MGLVQRVELLKCGMELGRVVEEFAEVLMGGAMVLGEGVEVVEEGLPFGGRSGRGRGWRHVLC